jgi:hypothetical protein
MQRRRWLQSMAAALLARPWAAVLVRAQAPVIGDREVATLIAIADVVLPASIGADGRRRVVDEFVRWIRNYRQGADRGHGYGDSSLSAPTGPPPAARYSGQFAGLDSAAGDAGAASFAALDAAGRRAIVRASLDGPPPVTRLPARPTGANLIADFMGFYFNSPAAYDLCYQGGIGRYDCRGLAGSEQAPK